MKNTYKTIFILAALAGCKSSDKFDPQPITTGVAEDDGTTNLMESGGGDDAQDNEGTGQDGVLDETGPTWGECDTGTFVCNGWVAGLYHHVNDPMKTGAENFWFGSPDTGEPNMQAQCIQIDVCIPFMEGAATDYLYEQCKLECERLDYQFAPYGDAGHFWVYSGVNACVFANAGASGGIPNDTYCNDVEMSPYQGDCYSVTNGPADNGELDSCTYCIDADDDDVCEPGETVVPYVGQNVEQVLYDGPCENSTCEMASCTGWNPSGWITSRYSSTSKTYTTTVDDVHLADLMSGGFIQLLACDDARWQQFISVLNVETWSMTNLAAGDFLYQLGFRSGDKEVRMRVNLAGSTWFYLYDTDGVGGNSGYDNMATAFNTLDNFTSFKIEFKRLVGGVWTTHFMNLTIN